MYSAQELLDRMEWEGDLAGVIAQGIQAKEVPSEVEEEWAEAVELLKQLDELAAAITARLELSAMDAQDEAWEDEWDDDEEEDE